MKRQEFTFDRGGHERHGRQEASENWADRLRGDGGLLFHPGFGVDDGGRRLSGLVGWWLDLLLLPALALFVLMAGYGFYRLQRRRAQDA